MAISQKEVTELIKEVNKTIKKNNIEFIMTAHFSLDRLNDIRNKPIISLTELKNVLEKVINSHLHAIASLPDKATFNIKCTTSHINMPCAISKTVNFNQSLHKNVIITIMRKEKFVAKDSHEFLV